VGNTAKRGFLTGVRDTIAEASNLHPEKTVVYLRNLVLAEKAWEVVDLETRKRKKRIAYQKSRAASPSKPVILLDFHFGHVGILKMLKWDSAKRLSLLRLYKPFVKDILKNDVRRDYLARLISVSWDGKKWQAQRNFLVDALEDL